MTAPHSQTLCCCLFTKPCLHNQEVLLSTVFRTLHFLNQIKKKKKKCAGCVVSLLEEKQIACNLTSCFHALRMLAWIKWQYFYKWAEQGIGISACECRDNTLSSCFSLWHLKRPTGAVESDCVVIFHLGILLQSCNCLISLLIRRLAFTDRVACSVVMRVMQIKWEVMGAWFHNFAVHKGVTNH